MIYIKIALMKITIAVMKMIYFFMKIGGVKNKITLVSSQSDSATLDISMLSEELEKLIDEENAVGNKTNSGKNGYTGPQIVVISSRMDRTPIGILKYIGKMFSIMKHFSNSKVIVVERYCIPASVLRHHKETKVVQIWHALGAIKKFGYQVLDMPSGLDHRVAKAMKVHENYDYVLCPSHAFESAYAEGFNVPKEKLLFMGMPRIDYLSPGTGRDEIKEKITTDYPEIKNRKTIIYAPTYRDGRKVNIGKVLSQNDYRKYNLVLKLHQFDKQNIDNELKNWNLENAIVDKDNPDENIQEKMDRLIIDDKYSTLDWISVADIIITDYSALALETAVAEKCLYFYTYDMDQYSDDRGLNIDINSESIKGYIFSKVWDLFGSIKDDSYDKQLLSEFRKKYVEDENSGNTYRLAKFLLDLNNDVNK